MNYNELNYLFVKKRREQLEMVTKEIKEIYEKECNNYKNIKVDEFQAYTLFEIYKREDTLKVNDSELEEAIESEGRNILCILEIEYRNKYGYVTMEDIKYILCITYNIPIDNIFTLSNGIRYLFAICEREPK